jgi:hypothetical protein
MSWWFKPAAQITSQQDASTRALGKTEGCAVGWGHERLVGCRAFEPCH